MVGRSSNAAIISFDGRPTTFSMPLVLSEVWINYITDGNTYHENGLSCTLDCLNRVSRDQSVKYHI